MSTRVVDSSVIVKEDDGRLLHLLHGTYDDSLIMGRHIKHVTDVWPNVHSQILFERVSGNGLISIEKNTRGEKSAFIIRFQNWLGTQSADVICSPPATAHRNAICSASFDEGNNRGILIIADKKTRYFCLFQFPDDAEYWEEHGISGLGSNSGWMIHETKGAAGVLPKKGFQITKTWMFVNDHTDNTRVTIEWTLQKRNWTPRNKLTMPSNRVASHYILSSEGDVSSINPLILDPLPLDDNPRGYLLNDERVPHTVSISPNKKDLFHVKSPNKEEDVEIKPSKHSTLADGKISHQIISLFAFLFLMTFALAHLSNTIENVVGFKLNDDQDFIFFLFSMLGSLLFAIYWGAGLSVNLYSRLNNAFRFHGIAWNKLVVIKERFPTILDVMEIEKLNDHILILSTDGIHGYNLRKGKTSDHLRHPIVLTERARFCPSTSDNLFAVYDQNRKMVYEKIFKIEGENSLLTCINESDFELQQLKEPDEEGRRFLEPYVGNISIDSILICAPDFTPSRKLCHHAKSQIKIEKAFNYFGISQSYNFDLDNILASPERIWGIYDVQDKNMMTEIRNWDSLFISDGNITRLGNNLQRIWVDEYEEWDDEKIKLHGLHWYGTDWDSRATSKPYGPYYSLPQLHTMLMSNIENSWNSDLYDPSDLRTIHSMDGDHEECILNTMAKTMVDLYPRPNEEVPLCKEMIPNLIAKTPTIDNHIKWINPSVDIVSVRPKGEERTYSEVVSLGQFTLWPSKDRSNAQDSKLVIDWEKSEFGERPFPYAGEVAVKNHPLFLIPEIKIEDAHADLFGDANTVIPLKDYANIIAELILLPCLISNRTIREFTVDDIRRAFYVHYKWSLQPTIAIDASTPDKFLQVPWLPFYEHLPAYHRYIQSDLSQTLDDMNLSNTEQNRLSAFGNTMLRGCTLEYFILECLLDLSNRKHYLQYSNIINTFVEERLKDLLRDFGEVRTTYNREFNERTSLICWNQNPSLPALVIDSVSDLSYSFYEELMNEPSGSRLSMEIGKAGSMLKQWKNVNPHFKLVSNIAGLIHQNNEDGSRSQGKIVFLLDRQKLLYESNLQIDFLHAQMKISAQLGLDDYPLIDRVDNHLVSPNLETLVFLCYALELDRSESDIHRSKMKLPLFTSLVITYFGQELVDLFYRLWNGVERSSGKAKASKTEVFTFEEDMPATSFLLMTDEEAAQNRPKQPALHRDHTGNAWNLMREEREFLRLREAAESILNKNLWGKKRTTRQHHMMHGDLYASNILLGGGGRLYLCDFSDTVYRRSKEVYYRLDEPIEGDSFISSHFFKRSDEGVAPRINAMADLAWFIATLLLKVPFEPQRNAMNDDVKEQLRRAWNSLPDESGERSSEFRIWFERELNVALDWADKFLKDVCYLTEGRDVEFKNRLKAMVFDGCLRLMAFQYARLPDVSKWQYHPDDIASCFEFVD